MILKQFLLAVINAMKDFINIMQLTIIHVFNVQVNVANVLELQLIVQNALLVITCRVYLYVEHAIIHVPHVEII